MEQKETSQETAPVPSPVDHDVLTSRYGQSSNQLSWQPSWKASLAVRGMTCASCVNTITHNLEKNSEWKVNINLLANKATVIYRGSKEDANQVVEAIGDLGYEAVLDQVVSTDEKLEDSDQGRIVEIFIDGFRCDFCPGRVKRDLETYFPGEVEVLSEPAIAEPIVKLRYTPDAPRFTVRHVLTAVERSDEGFTARIHHPPTLEERAKKLAAHHRRDLFIRVIITAVLAIPTFVIGIIYMTFVPDHDPVKIWLMEPWRTGIGRAQFILLVLATPVFFWSASIFHKLSIREIVIMWRPTSDIPLLQRFYRFGSMNLLISLGTGVAYLSSCAQMIAAAFDHPKRIDESSFYFDAVVFLTLFLLIGRLIEAYSKSRTGDAVESLIKLRPTTAILVETDDRGQARDVTIPVDQLEFNDSVRIPHGTSPACDGFIAQGETRFDESSLTGESRLVNKSEGDPVYAGTVNKDAPVVVKITGVAGRSMIDQVVKIVREGHATRASVEKVADVLTSYFVPAITLISIVTWIVWLVVGLSGAAPMHFLEGESSSSWIAFSLRFSIAVFVVACPCGLGLAAPTAIVVGSGLAAAKYGILVKGGGEAFEKASRVDCVVFDKTGTLTVGGKPGVTDSILALGDDIIPAKQRSTFFGVLRSAEENSSHPIAKAIVSFCTSRIGSSLPQQVSMSDVQEIPGKGLKATATYDFTQNPKSRQVIDVSVGNETLMTDLQVEVPLEASTAIQTWKTEAKSVALFAIRTRGIDKNRNTGTWKFAAAFSISDPIRPESADVVRTLRESGLDVWMLSGDNTTTAGAVARQIGIPNSNVIAGVLPKEKHERIAWLQSTLDSSSNRRRSRPLRLGVAKFFNWRREVGSPEKKLEEGMVAQREEQQLGGKITGGFDIHVNVGTDPIVPEQNSERRATIAMVGDGINDAAALNTADVGVAVGSGSDVAIASADFVLISNNLCAMVTLLDLSRTVLRRIKFNFAWALAYNLLAVPVAAGCFYPIVVQGKSRGHDAGNTEQATHIKLEPEWAGLAMAASSISVVLSSLALRSGWMGIGFRPRKIDRK